MYFHRFHLISFLKTFTLLIELLLILYYNLTYVEFWQFALVLVTNLEVRKAKFVIKINIEVN